MDERRFSDRGLIRFALEQKIDFIECRLREAQTIIEEGEADIATLSQKKSHLENEGRDLKPFSPKKLRLIIELRDLRDTLTHLFKDIQPTIDAEQDFKRRLTGLKKQLKHALDRLEIPEA